MEYKQAMAERDEKIGRLEATIVRLLNQVMHMHKRNDEVGIELNCRSSRITELQKKVHRLEQDRGCDKAKELLDDSAKQIRIMKGQMSILQSVLADDSKIYNFLSDLRAYRGMVKEEKAVSIEEIFDAAELVLPDEESLDESEGKYCEHC